MDANKREELLAIGYKVRKTCGLCAHANLSPDGWGTCSVRTYEHKKHSGSKRQLSIYSAGYCEHKFVMSDRARAQLGAFEEFLEP